MKTILALVLGVAVGAGNMFVWHRWQQVRWLDDEALPAREAVQLAVTRGEDTMQVFRLEKDGRVTMWHFAQDFLGVPVVLKEP